MSHNEASSCRSRGRCWLILAVVALVSGGIGAAIGSRPHAPGPEMLWGAPDANAAGEYATWAAENFARHVSANPAQKEKIDVIAASAAKELYPLRERMKALRNQGIELLRQPSVSRDEIEKLRTEHMAIADAVSKRAAQALGEMADVLTPDQRKGLADELFRFTKHQEKTHG